MRRIIVTVIIIAALAGAAYLIVRQVRAGSGNDVEIVREATVERDQITATVNATGTIEPEAMASLSFGVGGTVQRVNVVRGQVVSAGDVLATLNTEELSLAVQQAEDALRIQELNLEQVVDGGPSAATLAAAEADIAAAEGNVIIAQASLEAARAAVAQAEAQRALLLAGPSSGELAAAQSQLTQAQQQQKAAQEAYNQTTRCVTVTQPSGAQEEVCPGLGAPEEQARASLASANAALAAAEARLSDLSAGARPADLQVANAAIQAAEAQVASAQGNITVAEANLARAQAAYDRLLEGPTQGEIAILEAQVSGAETSLALAQLRLRQAMITAPMDGQVANVLIRQGEVAAPGAPAVTVVDEAGFHIEVNVDEIDIDQIAVGSRWRSPWMPCPPGDRDR
jgi:HlyD family secretion protein